jgi:DNA-directed RNA polymerase specialized sigma24 family protein
MNLDELYTAYTTAATESTLSSLYNGVRRYATELARRWRHPDPEDAAAGVAASAWAHLSRFKPNTGHTFTAWIKTIALNQLRTDHSKQHETVEYNADMDISQGEYTTLERAGLTPTQRETVQTLITTGDFASTAKQLGISRETLLRRLNRMKK